MAVDFSALKIPGIENPSTLAIIARARGYQQYCKAVADVLGHKPCPFCPPLDPNYNKVIAENNFWHAWQSFAPEKNTKHHFIITPKRHVKSVSELDDTERITLFDLINILKKMHAITSCGILIRDGDARLSAGTIEHLHVHLMVPDGTGRVESPFYKGDQAEAEGLARAMVYEKLRTGIEPKNLSDEERQLVEGRLWPK